MRTTLAYFGVPAFLLLPALPASAQTAPPEEEPMPPTFRDLSATPRTASSSAPVDTVSASPPPPVAPPSTTMEPDSFLPTLWGPIGLYGISTAEVGPASHLRLALHGQYFNDDDFLIKGDHDSRVAGAFTFGFTPNKNFELFGALTTSSNRNHRPQDPAQLPPRRDPELIKSFGDLTLGGKAVTELGRGATVGFELGLKFLSSISDLSVSPSSTSLWVGPVFTLDLRPLGNVPLRFHANANFYLDNSNNLIVFDEMTTSKFTREVAMFAYGMAASRLRFGLGVDAPLEKLTDPVPLQPFMEYHVERVTDDADPAFMNEPNDTHNRDQQWLTFGLRARVYRGVTVDFGSDVRLRSVGYQYGPPLPPYQFIFGLSYPLDIDAFRRPVVVTRTIEKTIAAPVPEEGRIAGTVTNAKDGKPIPAALVSVNGRPRSRVATDPDGTFLTGPLPPGPADLEISAPNFDGNTVRTAVTAGHRPLELNVSLTPKVLAGNVRGKVTDGKGQGLQATIRFNGSEIFEAKSDSTGSYSASLPAGSYKVKAEAPGYPDKELPLDIVSGQDRQLAIMLKTPNPDVTLAGDTLNLRQPIKFRSGTPKLEPAVEGELDGVADLLGDHLEIRAVRVEAHWDAAGPKGKALTEKQAGMIKEYLVKKGVSEGRVEAAGMGADKPLVPNIGPSNKAKNRRIEIKVIK